MINANQSILRKSGATCMIAGGGVLPVVADGFVTQHSHLAVQNSKLREKLMATHRYQRAMGLKNAVADERH